MNPIARFVAAAFVFGVALPLHAQSWRGSAGIEVRVEDARGKAVAAAEVDLSPVGASEPGGPATLATDGRGRVAIGGLAPGRWALEVRKLGFMTFRAELALAADEKPEILVASQHNVPGALSTLRVRLAKAGGAAIAPARANGRSGPAAASPAPPPAKSAAKAPPPPMAPPAARAPEPTPAPARPEKAPERAPAVSPPPAPPVEVPATSAAPAQPPAPRERAPMAPAKVPAASPPAPPVEVPAASPPPAPPAPPVKVPAASPLPASPAPPSPAPPKSERAALPIPPAPAVAAAPGPSAGGCLACRPGESALAAAVEIEGGGAACPAEIASSLGKLALSEVEGLSIGLPAGCALLRLELPAKSRYTGFRFEAAAPTAEAVDCLPGRDCPAGGCRFVGQPVVRWDGERQIVLALFESSEARRATLTVYARAARRD